MPISYPSGMTDARDRSVYALRAQYLLRVLANTIGTWKATGLSQEQYDALPQKIRDRYAYAPILSAAHYQNFQDSLYLPAFTQITASLNTEAEQLAIAAHDPEPDPLQSVS